MDKEQYKNKIQGLENAVFDAQEMTHFYGEQMQTLRTKLNRAEKDNKRLRLGNILITGLVISVAFVIAVIA